MNDNSFRKGLVVLFVLVAALAFFICKQSWLSADDHSQQVSRAQAAADVWLKLVDEGEYGKSWVEAAAYFKRAVTEAKWRQSLNAVRTPLGKLRSRVVQSQTYSTSLPGAPDGEYVVIQYKSSFEHKKIAMETVTPMKDKDGEWRVSGYFIK
jgi:hypothetical protein